MALRRFKYRDDATIDDYLGSLEQGLVEGETRREETSRTGSGNLGVPSLGLGVGGEASLVRGTESSVRQNYASKVEKLFRLLRAAEPKELWDFDDLNDDDWACLGEGSLIDLPVSIRVSQVSAAFAAAKDIGPLMTVMQSFVDVDNETAKQMAGLAQFGESGGSERLAVVATAEQNDKYKFVCRLSRSNLLVPFNDLEGTARLLAQIEDLIEPGQRELAVDVSGMGLMNREARRKAARRTSREDSDTYVVGPGAFVHVIALYK